MTRGFIDGASLAQIAQLLDRGPNGVYPWSWTTAIEVTSLLIGTNHLYVAPGPSRLKSSKALMNALLEAGLIEGGIVTREKIPVQSRSPILKATKTWASKNTDALRNCCAIVKADENGSQWLDWNRTRFWPEHAARLGGLFDRDLIPHIAKVLDIGEADLERIWRNSGNVDRLTAISCWHTEEFAVMQDAYLISVLLRGIFNDYLARYSSLQILHHPVRSLGALKPIHMRSTANGNLSMYSTNTEQYVARIVVASAFAEPDVYRRIALWSENVGRIRRGGLAERIDLRDKANEERALTSALEAARKVDVRVTAKRLEKLLDCGAALGVGILTSFFLSPLGSLAVSMGTYFLSEKTSIGKRITNTFARREKHLRALAEAGPGRLERKWCGLT